MEQLKQNRLRGTIKNYKTSEGIKYVVNYQGNSQNIQQTFNNIEDATQFRLDLNIQYGAISEQLIKSYGDYIGIITSSGKECLIDNNMIDKLMDRNISFSQYCSIKMDKKCIFVHRLVMNALKHQIVDHIDGDTLNNRVSNLRITTQSVNAYNSKVSTNTSGCIGVSFYSKKWHADIMIAGIKKTKTCLNKDEAIRVRKQWESELSQEYQLVPNKQITRQ